VEIRPPATKNLAMEAPWVVDWALDFIVRLQLKLKEEALLAHYVRDQAMGALRFLLYGEY
jgi:hypothetical protein